MWYVSIVAYQDYQDRCRPHKRRNWIFIHVGLSAHTCNIFIVQEVEVVYVVTRVDKSFYTLYSTLE